MSVPHTHIEQQEGEQAARDAEAALEAHRSFRLGLAYGRFVYRSRWFISATMRLPGRWNWWLPGCPMPQEQREASQ